MVAVVEWLQNQVSPQRVQLLIGCAGKLSPKKHAYNVKAFIFMLAWETRTKDAQRRKTCGAAQAYSGTSDTESAEIA